MYACVHYVAAEDAEGKAPLKDAEGGGFSGNGADNDGLPVADGSGLNWYCKSHKCPRCMPVDMRMDEYDYGRGDREWNRAEADAAMARIADTARAALSRLRRARMGSEMFDPYAVYGFRTILEMCGPVHGEVHICACTHPLSSHYLGIGECMDCDGDSACASMRVRKSMAGDGSET